MSTRWDCDAGYYLNRVTKTTGRCTNDKLMALASTNLRICLSPWDFAEYIPEERRSRTVSDFSDILQEAVSASRHSGRLQRPAPFRVHCLRDISSLYAFFYRHRKMNAFAGLSLPVFCLHTVNESVGTGYQCLRSGTGHVRN